MPYYDHDKDYPFAAFITNLGKYNEGELVGEWVKFPTTAEELKEVFKRIGIGQKGAFMIFHVSGCLLAHGEKGLISNTFCHAKREYSFSVHPIGCTPAFSF